MTTLLTDLRIALRTLTKARGFTAAAVLSLGLGITLCTAVLASVNAYLVRGLPYPAAERLCSVRYAAPGADTPDGLERLNWASLADVIEHPIAWDLDMFYLVGGDHTEPAPGAWVTPDFVEGLGVRPALGRGLDASAFVAGSPQVALISHRLWQGRFGGNPNIIGQTFHAYVSDRPEEAESFTIAGVLPADFWHTNPFTDILAPLRAPTYPYLVRLRDGVSKAEAAARITALVRAETPGLPQEWHVLVTSTHDAYVARVRPILRAVRAAAALVFLVALGNVTALRADPRDPPAEGDCGADSARRRPGRHRTALPDRGAAARRRRYRHRSCRQRAGHEAARADDSARAGAVGSRRDRGVRHRRDGPGRNCCLGIVTALACGLAPLAASWRGGLLAGLHSGSRTATEGRGSHRTRSVLIALEVAASLALLAGSTLMIQSVVALVRSNPGVRPERVLTTSLTLRQRSYPDAASRLAFFERVPPRVAAIPGVESVALATSSPVQALRPQGVEVDGPGGRSTVRISVAAISSAYLETMGVPIAAGRAFEPSDRAGAEPVAIVSEALARRISPDGRAIGVRVLVQEADVARQVRTVVRQVVGIAGNVRQTPADDDLADLYVPLPQTETRYAVVYVRTSGAPVGWLPQLRAAFKEIDPEVALNNPRPLQSAFDEQLARPAFLAWLLAGFAIVAAVLALVGVYGVIAYAVAAARA